MSDLNKINPIYQFSLKAFHGVFEKAIQRTAPSDDVKQRVINLTDEITYSVHTYTARGLFERDKLIFLAQVAFQVLAIKKEVNLVELDFLLRFPSKAGVTSPVDFLQPQGWGGIKVLSEMEAFKNLDSDIEGSAKRWKKLVESEVPEKEAFPKEWKSKSALQKLCVLRCLRPDRMSYNALKITNEPPTGMEANLHKALDLFTQDTLEMCSKEIEFKCILFALCYFHAVVAERRKFGTWGWNRSYPFNNGDLTISINVLYNYLEANPKVPWDDLRYLFGEIMYGGHITDDWDRRLCRTYLSEYIHAELLEGEVYLAPGFLIPPSLDYEGYHKYIDENLPPESPHLYGLHPNAEIGFLTAASDRLCRTVLEMQPKESDAGGVSGVSREEKVKSVLEEIVARLPEPFSMADLTAKAVDRTPYVVVAFQECERMNTLTREMRRSLTELDLGLKGELTITSDMEELANALFYDNVPAPWAHYAYPSLLSLGAWYTDLLLRIRELDVWTTDFALPATVWLAGFFNPQSFLTAIMQSTARKNEWPLDKMCLSVEVTKKNREDLTAPPREGSYVHGLFMEGARWDVPSGGLADARLKELTPLMPVIFLRAVPADRLDTANVYECPVYKTRMRGPTYVWTFNLKTKERAAKWILAAVALLLQT
uniref:Uncharacterized protein n=1 Tax=Bubo bubo TaxID=30461 RepID=A0A8C0IA98_BUBBB